MAQKEPANIDLTVKNYAFDLSRIEIVDAKQEMYLFLRYRDYNDIEARNKLVESGLRFVFKVAQKFSRNVDHQKCLICAGNEGLLIAVDRFDPSRGVRFLTYATWWVVLYIREELHRQTVVSVPIWRKKSARKVQHVQNKLREKLGREATNEELKEETGFSVNQIRGVLQDQHSVVPIDEEREAIILNENLEQSTINLMGDRLIHYLMMNLPIRERFILQAYFGFVTEPAMSLKQIAMILNISSERVRQIKIEALETLKRLLYEYRVFGITDVYDYTETIYPTLP